MSWRSQHFGRGNFAPCVGATDARRRRRIRPNDLLSHHHLARVYMTPSTTFRLALKWHHARFELRPDFQVAAIFYTAWPSQSRRAGPDDVRSSSARVLK